ncbi:MAG TPA: hypothetical protein PLP23_13805 [Panacibacter sp.]|nr:hypothetical protein [Panacibacter sp.]
MSWFSQLFQDHSSAVYVILIYAIVIAAGVALGKLAYKGVSFGIAFVFFLRTVSSKGYVCRPGTLRVLIF